MARTLRLPTDVAATLKEYAEKAHRSENSVIVEAVELFVSAPKRRRSDALARIIAEDKEILDRLA